MLCSILFNLGGYALLFQYLINRSDSSIYERINDNRYKMNDLVEIKIPVNQQTVEDEDEYAPVGGQVKLSDTVYNFAYLKMTRDTMYLLCLPNREKASIKNAKIIYTRQISDISVNEKSHLPVMKLSTFEGYNDYYNIAFQTAVSVKTKKTLPDYSFLNIVKTSIGVPGQPPEVSSLC
jgi:hypothetical protein